MPERDATAIRQEMAAERARLNESREALKAELRSLVPILVLILVAVGFLTAKKGVRGGIRTVRRLS
jgi:hypothetical protein